MIESVLQEIATKSPDSRVLGVKLTYDINFKNTILYKTSSADIPVNYNDYHILQRPISPTPIINAQGLYQIYPIYKKETKEGWRTELSVSEQTTPGDSPYLYDPETLSTARGNANPLHKPNLDETPKAVYAQRENTVTSQSALKKPLAPMDKSAEIEWVKMYATGDQNSVCWPIYENHTIVYEIGSDQKICVIISHCLHNNQRMQKGVELACRFDSDKKTCPTATECLKDPYFRIKQNSSMSYFPMNPQH